MRNSTDGLSRARWSLAVIGMVSGLAACHEAQSRAGGEGGAAGRDARAAPSDPEDATRADALVAGDQCGPFAEPRLPDGYPRPRRIVPVCTVADLRSAIRDARAGDAIELCSRDWNDLDVTVSSRGAPGAPVVLRAAVAGRARLTGIPRLRVTGMHVVVDSLVLILSGRAAGPFIELDESSRFVRITNVTMHNPRGSSGGTNDWVDMRGQDNRIDHCHFSGQVGPGQTIGVYRASDAIDRHSIDRNYFGPRPSGGANGSETIRLNASQRWSQSVAGSRITENYFERTDGEVETVSVKCSHNLIWHNTFDDVDGSITLRVGDFNQVDSNFFFGRGRAIAGIRISGEGHVVVNNYLSGVRDGIVIQQGNVERDPTTGGPGGVPPYERVMDVLLAYNTILDTESAFHLGNSQHGTSLAARRLTFTGNLVDDAGTVFRVRSMPLGMTHRTNLHFRTGSLGLSTSAWSRADPRLTTSSGLRVPGSGSPAVDRGADADVPGDARGICRARPDIGALERGAGGVLPITSRDVGPTTYDPVAARR